MANFYMLGATGGLIILHASQIQVKNATSVLISNLISIAIGTIAYWAFGFAFAIGNGTKDASNFFFSHTNFFLMYASEKDYVECTRTVIILAFVIVIMNSGFISRLRCWVYPILIIFVAGFLYPCVYHWINASDGWLRAGISVGDRAVLNYEAYFGCGYIHVYAGSMAIFGSIFIGSRKELRGMLKGRKTLPPLGGNFTPLIVLGGILALVGLTAKNSIHPEKKTTSALALLNNILAAQASALVAFSLKRSKVCGDSSATKSLINGALAGIVSVSCAAHDYHPYGAFVIGFVGGLSYNMWSGLLSLCHIDDPTDSVSVHLGAGIWAMIAGPIFRKTKGFIYSGEEFHLKLLGWHILSAVAIFVWSGLTLLFIFMPFYKCATYGKKEITIGLDELQNLDPAFPEGIDYLHETESDMGYENDHNDVVVLEKSPRYPAAQPRAYFTNHSTSTLTRYNGWDDGSSYNWHDAKY